jgi:hypothetical protein
MHCDFEKLSYTPDLKTLKNISFTYGHYKTTSNREAI